MIFFVVSLSIFVFHILSAIQKKLSSFHQFLQTETSYKKYNWLPGEKQNKKNRNKLAAKVSHSYANGRLFWYFTNNWGLVLRYHSEIMKKNVY